MSRPRTDATCPDCGGAMRVVSTRRMGRDLRRVYLSCLRSECAAQYECTERVSREWGVCTRPASASGTADAPGRVLAGCPSHNRSLTVG